MEKHIEPITASKKKLAKIKPFKFNDKLTGNIIEVAITPYCTVLSVNSRHYYFSLETGEFDGTSFAVNREH